MDTSPVSAFAIYRRNKNTNQNKRQQKKEQRKRKKEKDVSTTVLPNKRATVLPNKGATETIDVMKTAAKKLKEKQKRQKEIKNIAVKKKSHKKKKLKVEKVKNKSLNKRETEIVQTRTEDIISNFVDDSESEEIPILVPAPVNGYSTRNGADEESMSSNGSFEFTPVQTNSVEEGIRVFNWMISPYNPKDFFNLIWEKKPLYINRKKSDYYKDLISTPLIDNMLRTETVTFTKNIDITSYVDGKRETHNPNGRAHPHVVWDYYLNGCSIRLLNPQTFIPKMHLLNATLQEFFNTFVGANVYLTPPDSQGFAPHWDDIEAFILQVEGKKQWKVYKPEDDKATLPRISSKNFDQNEIGDPIIEVTLEAGDMLYFPRGYIHQGVTIDGEHSLHVTISAYQRHSWADLFERMVPEALQAAIADVLEYRRGLPFDLYDNFGLVNSDVNSPRKQEMVELIRTLCDKIKDYLPIDNAVDELAKKYQHVALPPVLTDLEKAVTVYGDSDVMVANGRVTNRVEIGLETRIRLLRRNILRMVMEEEGIKIYYSVENSLEYEGNDLQFLEIDEHIAPAVETLIMSYPEYVFVENLDVPAEADKLQIATDLWERGLIMTEYPLDVIEDD